MTAPDAATARAEVHARVARTIPGPTAPQLLATRGLSVRHGDRIALHPLELDLVPGERLALIGPNGAGKSSLLAAMAGLNPGACTGVRALPSAVGESRQAFARHVGYCPQVNLHWPDLRVREQLVFVARSFGLARAAADTRAEALMRLLELGDRAEALGRTLSGGMQRRLALGLALVHRPRVLLLDEPAAGLDLDSRRIVARIIAGAPEAPHDAVLWSTHDLEEAERLADRVILLHQGRVLALDAPARLTGLTDQARQERTLELSLETGVRARAAEVLAAAGLHFTATPAGLEARAPLADASTLLERALAALHAAALNPGELTLRRRTLADVFFERTGLRPGA